jgi:hypothetical protein
VPHRVDDDVVPDRARIDAQRGAVERDPRRGEPHDGQIGQLVGDHDIGPARQHQRPTRFRVQRAQRGDDLIRCAASDHPPRDRADPQRGQRRKRNALRHLRAGVVSGGHGR